MSWITFVGLFAATCTTLCYLPQTLKIIKSKHTKDISLGMYVVLTIGISSWLIYGILIENLPIIIANIFTLILTASILLLKIRHG